MKLSKRNSVKEAFDNLPSGVCFFDKNGIVTLCNHQMYRLVFALTGKDLQIFSDMQEILEGNALLKQRDNDIFILDDGSAWHFYKESITTQEGNSFIQVIAADVTELYLRQNELKQDNRKLEEYSRRMRQLSANIITLIREEEILNMKMRVHDDIGRSVIATRQFIRQNRPMSELDLTAWKNAVRLLKHDNELSDDKDGMERLAGAAKGLGIKILLDGDMPEDTKAAGLVITAVRECMTNAVRHAGADELYVKLTCDGNMFYALISNNGAAPESEITEGGGLSSLKARVKKCGGEVKIKSMPRFERTVELPVGLEKTV